MPAAVLRSPPGRAPRAPENINGSVGYGLDPVGNRQSASSSITGVSSGSFGYDADDRLSTETYDLNGNVTSAGGGRTLVFDSENHLISMNSGAVTIVYDGDGNRVAKTVGTTTTKYLVDDLNPTGYAQVVEELVSGAVQREYSYGLQRISQDQLINSTWTPSFYGYDGFGSVRQLTNSLGTIRDTFSYDAFGVTLERTGTTPNVYMYRGEQYDSDLGLYYLRARYYNSLTGRFLSRDPAEGRIDIPATLHKYLYVGGDPVNWIDPSGRDAEEVSLLDTFLERAVLYDKVQSLQTLSAGGQVVGAFSYVVQLNCLYYALGAGVVWVEQSISQRNIAPWPGIHALDIACGSASWLYLAGI
jgi:RHS repeat-associated protein